MKRYLKLLLVITTIFTTLTLCACNTNNSENLAKDLDSTVKNLVVVVSTLDWPEDGDLDNFNNIKHTSSTTQTSDSTIVVDTQIDTSEIYTWLENVHSKINIMLSKRGDLLLYLNEMYGGNTSLTEEDIFSINVYMNILKDNSNYLNSYKGMLKNQINEAKEIYASNSNTNLINAYLIKAVETLQLRSAKIDTSILAMTSIIDIIKNNLTNNYFSYNEHELQENEINPENINKQADNKQSNNNINDNSTAEDVEQDEQTENINDQEDLNNQTPLEENTNSPEPLEENAINFDGEVSEVENVEDANPVPTDNTSYDYLVKTLEEPIIEDATTQNIDNKTENINYKKEDSVLSSKIIDNQTEDHKNIDNLKEKTEVLKDIEIDKDFSVTPQNEKVTREVIHDKSI